MCGVAQNLNIVGRALGHDTFRKIDPVIGNLEDFDKRTFSAPKLPTPLPMQEAKLPDSLADRRTARKNAGMSGGGSLLTGPSGVQTAAANLGSNTLLGA